MRGALSIASILQRPNQTRTLGAMCVAAPQALVRKCVSDGNQRHVAL